MAELRGVESLVSRVDWPNNPWLYLEAPDSLGVPTVDRMLENDVIEPIGGRVGRVNPYSRKLRCGVDSDRPKIPGLRIAGGWSSGSDSRLAPVGSSE